MADKIWSNRFFSHRVPAWHGKGITTDEKLTAIEAWSRLAPYTLELRPLYGEIASLESGWQREMVEKPFASIVRGAVPDDNVERDYGVVGADYQLISPQDVCNAFDATSGGKFVNTIGSLDYGKYFFLTTRLNDFGVGDDVNQSYLFIASPYVPGESLQLIETNISVVCWNTWQRASNSGKSLWRGNHSSPHIQQDLADWLMYTMREKERNQAQAFEFMETLVSFKIKNEKQVDKIIEYIYPSPTPLNLQQPKSIIARHEEAFAKALKNVNKKRTVVRELFDGKMTGFELPQRRGTGWGMYNAVTEFENYAFSTKDATTSVLFGDRADRMIRASSVLVAEAKR